MPKPLVTKVCADCGTDSAGTELGSPCPSCGSREVILSHRPITISSEGPATVTVPLSPTGQTGASIGLRGNVNVSLPEERRTLSFRKFKKFKCKHDSNFVQIALRRDARGLDIVFGRRSGGEQHSHYSYPAHAATHYSRDQGSTELTRQRVFDDEEGVFVPEEDRIDDAVTGMSLVMTFRREGDEVVIVGIRFVPLGPQ